VDIAGDIDDRLQTIAERARRSPACKHRGVKLAVAARARKHAALLTAKGLSYGGASAAAVRVTVGVAAVDGRYSTSNAAAAPHTRASTAAAAT
jgi:hypothetical protein